MQNQTETEKSAKSASKSSFAREKKCKNFNQPDESRPFRGHGHLDVLKFGDQVQIGRGIFEPGWQWSVDVKPIAGTESCEASHSGYCVEGSMRIAMDTGEEFTIQAGDGFHIPSGHDAWVLGTKPCVLIDVMGYRDYALEKPAH